MKLWRSHWPRLKQLTTLISILKEENRLPRCLGLKLNTSLVNVKGSLYIRYAGFSLNFSSAGKGLFMAGNAKNAPEAHFPGNYFRQIGPSKCLILIILLCLQCSLEFPKCLAHSPHIHSFPWSDQTTTCLFFKTTIFNLVIFSFQFNFQLQVVRSAASAACK